MFVRFQSPLPGKRGVHTGVFVLTNLLGYAGRLTPDEHATWRAGNDWYNAAYPNPTDTDPTIYDVTANPRAAAWFKESATHLIERGSALLGDPHGAWCGMRPGRV
ncbi:hypothetical protein [Isoptericola sp. NPDC055881]